MRRYFVFCLVVAHCAACIKDTSIDVGDSGTAEEEGAAIHSESDADSDSVSDVHADGDDLTGNESSCILNVSHLYTQTGNDPPFDALIADGTIPVGIASTQGVTGSTIDINNELLETCSPRQNNIPQEIRIHTLCNSVISRKDFPKWTRWYQEDGNTQIFRLFKGEHNVHNDRPDAARIESFTNIAWQEGDGWYEWTGTYTIIKPHACAIFQAKNNLNDWGIMLNMTDDGDVILNHRRHKPDFTIAENMTGVPFEITVRDNGREYEVYLNGDFMDNGYYDRPEGKTNFRWGMYDKTLQHDAMLLVTGVIIVEP